MKYLLIYFCLSTICNKSIAQQSPEQLVRNKVDSIIVLLTKETEDNKKVDQILSKSSKCGSPK